MKHYPSVCVYVCTLVGVWLGQSGLHSSDDCQYHHRQLRPFPGNRRQHGQQIGSGTWWACSV